MSSGMAPRAWPFGGPSSTLVVGLRRKNKIVAVLSPLRVQVGARSARVQMLARTCRQSLTSDRRARDAMHVADYLPLMKGTG